MPKRIAVRAFTGEEQVYLEKMSRSRRAAKQVVERASILLSSAAGERIGEIAIGIGRRAETVLNVVKRFNTRGLESLEHGLRSGRPLIYGEFERSAMVGAAKTYPQQLKLPYSHWTLDRLLEYAHQALKIPISRSQLEQILQEEGLKWYQEKTYFMESPDPQFVQKRGDSELVQSAATRHSCAVS